MLLQMRGVSVTNSGRKGLTFYWSENSCIFWLSLCDPARFLSRDETVLRLN